MADPDPRLRLTDLAVIKVLVREIMGEPIADGEKGNALSALLNQLSLRNEKLAWLESALGTSTSRLEEAEARNRALEQVCRTATAAELGDTRRRACELATEAATIRESRVMRLARGLKGQPDLWGGLPATFEPVKRDAVRSASAPVVQARRGDPLAVR
jgi:hypothetical protein